MSEIKCPYCNTAITENDNVCPKCGKELNIQCPYCKQPIKAYNEVCPYCTSKLVTKDYSKILLILGWIVTGCWTIGNMLLVTLFSYYPKIFTLKDRHDTDAFMVADYLRICGTSMLVQLALFLIAFAIQSKVKKAAIAGVITNVLLFLSFVFYVLYLKFTYA